MSGGGRYGQSTIPSKPQSDSKTNTWSIKRTEYDTNKKNQPLDSEHRERGGYYRSNVAIIPFLLVNVNQNFPGIQTRQ